MNRQEFSTFRDAHYAQIAEINDKKGKDYAGDDDALANFKAAAEQLGMSPYQVWAIYHHKHQSAINSFIREGKVESEGIEGRIHDAILYLFLLLGLINDLEPGNEPALPAAVEYREEGINRCTATTDPDSEVGVLRCERRVPHGGSHWARDAKGHPVEWTT